MDDDHPVPARREIRLVAQPRTRLGEAVTAVHDLLGIDSDRNPWRVEPLFSDDPDAGAIIRGTGEHEMGSGEYISAAIELAHQLGHSDVFRLVQADLPVIAFDRTMLDPSERSGARPEPTDPAPNPRWNHALIGLDEAWRCGPWWRQHGRGIRIALPDTGYTDHPAVGTAIYDLSNDRDFIDNDDDPVDPLRKRRFPWQRFLSHGHGTASASIIASHGDPRIAGRRRRLKNSEVVGIAPAAEIISLRASNSTVQFFASDLARAVNHARLNRCHVISIGIGTTGFFGLDAAIRKAVNDGLIVTAAAGNNPNIVSAPASYNSCIGVAAVTPQREPWPWTSAGAAIDIAAPGVAIPAATYDLDAEPPQPTIDRLSGTSQAVCHVSGAAALWLARHSRRQLVKHYGRARIQGAFLHVLRETALTPDGWNSNYGVGILDVARLLEYPLPDPDAVTECRAGGSSSEEPTHRLAGLIPGTDAVSVRARLGDLLGAGGSQLDKLVGRHEAELCYLAVENPDFRAKLLPPTVVELERRGIDRHQPEVECAISAELRSRFENV